MKNNKNVVSVMEKENSVPANVCGCVAEDTMVTMGDGVRNCIKGVENKLYVLTLEDGKTLRATGRHPIMTEEGFKAIQSLTEKDCVRIFDDKVKSVASIKKEMQGVYVYTLELDGEDHGVYLNEILAGDFVMENSLIMAVVQ